jgi:hypothetical protein
MTEEKQRESLIRNELTRLANAHGGNLQPSVVVNAARPEDSPLHHSFEWDDSEAAEKWRLQQARQLITAVVKYETIDGKSVPVQVFVSLTTDRKKDGAGYRLTQSVMSDDEHRHQLLTDALQELNGFKLKYRRLTELAKVFEALEQVQAGEFAKTG